MKLYYSPGSCAMAAHIVANEAGVPVELVKVDLRAKTTESGADFLTVNPNGYVPALIDDQGELLTEASVVVQFIADQNPEAGLIPAPGARARYRVLQLLTFISTELHKGFSPFFKPDTPDAMKDGLRDRLKQRIAYVDGVLSDKTFLTGDSFTVADAYLWTILGWAKFARIDLGEFANVSRFIGAVAARPAVQKTLAEEGLA